MCCGSPDISTEYKETSNSNKYQKEMQYTDKNKISGQENGGIYSELYEQYARKERQVKSSEKNTKRPDWNINKPGKRYIPASERYPKQLQKQREANKVRRQMELLQLVERNTPGNLCPKNRSPSPHEEMDMKNKRHRIRKVTTFSLAQMMSILKTFFTQFCLDVTQALRIFTYPLRKEQYYSSVLFTLCLCYDQNILIFVIYCCFILPKHVFDVVYYCFIM